MDEAALLHTIHQSMEPHMGGVYVTLFLAPFVQEDAAVVAAASLSLAGMGDGGLIFAIAVLGLTLSDLWKFWIGRAARTRRWAQKFSAKPAVAKAQSLVTGQLGKTLMSVRFIPGARIPLYVAAGYFGARWPRFAFWIAVSSIFYVAAIFALFHAIGAVAGEAAKIWLPIIAISIVAIYVGHATLKRRAAARPQS